MLDSGNGEGVIDVLWNTIAGQTRLPDPQHDFYEVDGMMPMRGDSRRHFHRRFYRRRSILILGKKTHGVYLKDLSRAGVGFLAPFQLFPRDVMTIVLPGPQKKLIEVRRCYRHAAECYECGAVFTDADPSEIASLE